MNCNARSLAGAADKLRHLVVRGLLAAIAGATTSIVLAASTAELDDTAARMQYAFFTADARALQDVLSLLDGLEGDAAQQLLQHYQLAYGHWKLAEIYAEAAETKRIKDARGLAAKAARACVEHARAASAADSRMAEAYAIEAACEGMPQSFLSLASLRSGSCARSRPLRTALAQAPQNPRVLFVEALCTREQDEQASLARWQKVVDAFAEAPPSRAGLPDWGYAEALTLLAEHHLQRGDLVAARDATERALVFASDYQAAQALLQTIASRRSN